MKSEYFQNPTISPVLPYDIIALIVDTAAENKDIPLLKELSLVSHSFLPICSKHLFATIELRDAVPPCYPSSKQGFVKLLKSRPEVVKYIRNLTYYVSPNNSFHDEFVSDDEDDQRLSPILPNLLRTILQPKYFAIKASSLSVWNKLDSSMTSAFLHLMHLPTINHIQLFSIKNLPLSSLISCVNLHQLDIIRLEPSSEDDHGCFPENFQSDMPRRGIHQFHTSQSSLLTTKLLHAKRPDGRPAFDFTDLKQLSMTFSQDEDIENIRHLLQNARLLEKLHLSVHRDRLNLVGLHVILSLAAPTLKALELIVPLYDVLDLSPPLAGLCEELKAMAGHNKLEALAFRVNVDGNETADFIGSIVQKVEEALVRPGWSSLRQVSFKISIACCTVESEMSENLRDALQSLPHHYLSRLSNLDSIAFRYSAYIEKCSLFE